MTLRPLGDRIIVRPLDWEPSKIITVIRHGRPLRGVVVAVGPGEHRKKYARDRSSYKLSRHFTPTDVKVGDTVELGGLNVFDGQGYNFPTIEHEGETLMVCSEKDVCGVAV